MTRIIDGKAVAAALRETVAARAGRLTRPPGLAVVLVGEDPASQVYVRSKVNDPDLAEDVLQESLLKALRAASASPALPTHEQILAAQWQPGLFAAAWDFLLDDLNVPGALGVVFGTLNSVKPAALSPSDALAAWQGLHLILNALGLQLPVLPDSANAEVPPAIQELAQKRWQAKQDKDWPTADTLRKELDAAGWIIKDHKDGFDILPK